MSLAAAVGACSFMDPWTTRDEDLRAVDDPLIPPGGVTFFFTLDEASLPDWPVRDGQGISLAYRELRVTKDRPVVFLVRVDRECILQIPSMRLSKAVFPGQSNVA
jgi:hypothetical protein